MIAMTISGLKNAKKQTAEKNLEGLDAGHVLKSELAVLLTNGHVRASALQKVNKNRICENKTSVFVAPHKRKGICALAHLADKTIF